MATHHRLRGFVQETRDYCFVGKGAIGMPPLDRNGPSMGRAVLANYPTEPGAVSLELDESTGGLVPATFVANTKSLIVVTLACAEYITQNFNVGTCEILPVRLVNAKGRTHAADYAMLNPVGTVDCLNRSLSDIKYTPSGKVGLITKYVLDGARIPPERDLFRVPEDVFEYFVSDRLVAALKQQGYTNFTFNPVEIG
jgi:hypothetical protein